MKEYFNKEEIAMRDGEQKSNSSMEQVENMAKFGGIELQDHDLRVKLYAILRADSKPKKN